jgi:hypothetical protein
MQRPPIDNKMLTWLIFGDVMLLLLVSVFGFVTHGTLANSGWRLLSTFIPLIVSWFCVAPFIGAYNLAWTADIRQLWRPFWAMILAAPLAAWMRAVWLGTPIMPIFVFVLGSISALAILVWRMIYWLVASRSRIAHG